MPKGAMPRGALPKCGVGLRRAHFDDVLSDAGDVDFFEIIPENYMRFGGKPRHTLREVAERHTVVMHGVSLSIGSLDPLNAGYLARLKELAREVRAPWFSDHLSYSSAHGVDYHDLIPLPFTRAAVRHVAARIREVQDRVGLPFAIENPSYYVMMPGAEMNEAEFINEVLDAAGCDLLLDVNNVYVNAVNHGYDARAFIKAMPRERVRQMHMAGHDATGSFIIDTHGAPIVDPVFELYAHTLRHVGAVPTLVEWDNDVPTYERLLEENSRVRDVARVALSAAGEVA